MPKLIGIVAMTPDRIIGCQGALPWHLPADLAFFKRTTSGHPILMGRKTYDSIGRPLPHRRNLVMTRDATWQAPGIETIHGPSELDSLTKADETVFIIGGSEIYRAFLPSLDELLISHIHHSYPGDTIFPDYAPHFSASEILETHPEFTVRRWLRTPR